MKTSLPKAAENKKLSHKADRIPGPQVIWTKNLATDEGVKEFIQLMGLSNGPVLKRLLEIVKSERERTLASCLKSDNYSSPSWALIQADNVGYQRALDLIERLLKDVVK